VKEPTTLEEQLAGKLFPTQVRRVLGELGITWIGARLRPRAASNVSGARFRTASTRSCGWPTSTPLSRPTPPFPRSWPGITPASARRQQNPARPTVACRLASAWPISSAFATGAPSARTTSSRLRAVSSRSRPAPSAALTPAPGSRYASTWTAALPSTTRAPASPANPARGADLRTKPRGNVGDKPPPLIKVAPKPAPTGPRTPPANHPWRRSLVTA
jgi:hypothetical protein